MNQLPQAWILLAACSVALATGMGRGTALGAGGTLTLSTRDVDSGQSVPARLELRSENNRRPTLRRAVPSGPGVVLNRSLDVTLPDGQYRFRIVRGPEYRVISGNFTLERTALDQRLVDLSRMVDMHREGFTSGDMAVPDAAANLPLQMAAEDLHVAAVVGQGKTLPGKDVRGKDPSPEALVDGGDALLSLQWTGASVLQSEDLLVYAAGEQASELPSAAIASAMPTASELLWSLDRDSPARVAIANPFAFQLPVWLASGRIDGLFVLGDWIRESSRVERVTSGRPPKEIGFNDPQGPGRYAEAIYWNLLDAGLEIAPLAGTGPAAVGSAVGYNRVYAIGPSAHGDDDRRTEPVTSEEQWYQAVWSGRSVVTNGPLLRPTLGGMAPGHRFEARSGERLEMSVELHLAVRDPVDYLEVIHNGEVFYSARLDEFAEAGGMIPELQIERSGWVLVRVVTLHEDHFRAAISAPWYIRFDDTPRISRRAVEFFADWLVDCETELKKLPPERLAPHIEPVKMARIFWRERLQMANAD